MREHPYYDYPYPAERKPESEIPIINIILLLATLLTTLLAGSYFQMGLDVFNHPHLLLKGAPFALTLMAILGSHELGHYTMSRISGVKATLPYFIPAPTFFGTFGAFIKVRSQLPEKRALLLIGAAGPIAGFLVAVPAVIAGLSMSEVRPQETAEGIGLGSSILFSILSRIVLGVPPENHDIILHPVAFAGWIGFFVTALNLLPLGQLDGGHILYALLGRRQMLVTKIAFAILFPLGFLWSGWFVWVFLIMVFGLRHPPIRDEEIKLKPFHRAVGIVTLIIFILTFSPVPFRFTT